jgi:hypothetical protein
LSRNWSRNDFDPDLLGDEGSGGQPRS